MSEHIEKAPGHVEHHDDDHHDGHDTNYFKIYVTLLVLLVISILGPEIGILWVTLITAFGIAFVKAYLVVQNFMHLRPEKVIVKWILAVSLLFMGLFFFGVAPDVMKHEGNNWENLAAMAAVERGIPGADDHGQEGEDAEHAEDGAVDGEGEGGEAAVVAEAPFDAGQAYNMYCSLCHGAAGGGDGPGGQALDPAPAAFATADFWAQTNDERMFNVIKNGGASEGLSAAMTGWGALLEDDEIRQMIEHLKTFRP